MHTHAHLGGNTIRKYVPQTEWQQIQKYAGTSWGAHPLRFTHTPPTAKPSLSFPLTPPRITCKQTEWQQIQIHTNTTNTNKNQDKSCLSLPLPNNHHHCHPHSPTLSKCPHVPILKPQDQGDLRCWGKHRNHSSHSKTITLSKMTKIALVYCTFLWRKQKCTLFKVKSSPSGPDDRNVAI